MFGTLIRTYLSTAIRWVIITFFGSISLYIGAEYGFIVAKLVAPHFDLGFNQQGLASISVQQSFASTSVTIAGLILALFIYLFLSGIFLRISQFFGLDFILKRLGPFAFPPLTTSISGLVLKLVIKTVPLSFLMVVCSFWLIKANESIDVNSTFGDSLIVTVALIPAVMFFQATVDAFTER